MAPHPFTTIDPNVGFCLIPAPSGSCPEDSSQGSTNAFSSVACTHGRDSFGRRLIPVMLKDVAGLVPGAYQGRGRGNKVGSYNVFIVTLRLKRLFQLNHFTLFFSKPTKPALVS
jgi:hypothetical protein